MGEIDKIEFEKKVKSDFYFFSSEKRRRNSITMNPSLTIFWVTKSIVSKLHHLVDCCGSTNKETWSQFHQHVYTQLLCTQIPKAQKAALLDSLLCTFGVCACKSCLQNVDEIDPWSQSYQTLIFFDFHFLLLSLSVCNI